jgi:hypothetical protein
MSDTDDAPATETGGIDEYDEFLREVKGRIQAAQTRAALALSREVVLLYWQIGRDIRDRQEQQGWGAKVVQRLAADLKAAFPGVEGGRERTCCTCGRSLRRTPILQSSTNWWTIPRCLGATTSASLTR